MQTQKNTLYHLIYIIITQTLSNNHCNSLLIVVIVWGSHVHLYCWISYKYKGLNKTSILSM